MPPSSSTAFGLNEQYLEEINERLLKTYLKDKHCFEKALSSADITSEEESDSSHKTTGCKNGNKKSTKCKYKVISRGGWANE